MVRKILAILSATASCTFGNINIFAMESQNVNDEKWIQLFDTNLISEDTLNEILEKSSTELNDRITENKRNKFKKGNFINQINGNKFIRITPDGSLVQDTDLEDIWRTEIDAVYNFTKNKRDKYKVLYEILSPKQNVCQTRASILLKHLRDLKKGIYVPIHTPQHVFPMILDQDLNIIGLDYDYYLDNFKSFKLTSDMMNVALLSHPIQIERDAEGFVSFGIWFFTLQRYLNENASEDTKEKFLKNLVLPFSNSLPFSFLPIIELPNIDGIFKTMHNGKKVVPCLLLSQNDNSLIPGYKKENEDLSKPISYKESNYSLENFNYIIDSCTAGGKTLDLYDKSYFRGFLKKFLNKIFERFPSSKILYLNKEFYDKKCLDFTNRKLAIRSASDWITSPVDGEFVLLAESLKTKMEKI